MPPPQTQTIREAIVSGSVPHQQIPESILTTSTSLYLDLHRGRISESTPATTHPWSVTPPSPPPISCHGGGSGTADRRPRPALASNAHAAPPAARTAISARAAEGRRACSRPAAARAKPMSCRTARGSSFDSAPSIAPGQTIEIV